MSNENQILWPSGFETTNCAVHVHNELAMTSPPETVWAWLIRAQLWPTWYPNSSNIKFLSGQPPDLALNTKLRWKTFGVMVESEVLEFVPYERLGWNAHGTGLNAYHAWLILKTDQVCKVVTEENQGGIVAHLGKVLRPTRMEQMHQIWLEKLSEKAISGLPPAT